MTQPEALREALTRLWPLIEAATKDRVFTAARAGEVGADMQTVRAALEAHGAPEPDADLWYELEGVIDDMRAGKTIPEISIATLRRVQAALEAHGAPEPDYGTFWLKNDEDLRYVNRVIQAGREMTDEDRRAAIDIVHKLRTLVRKEYGAAIGAPDFTLSNADLAALLPGSYYMDPPDGGDVSLFEQLRRMSVDAANWRHQAQAVASSPADDETQWIETKQPGYRTERDSSAVQRPTLEKPSMNVTDEMVSRFLTWKLPEDFGPDCGIAFAGFHPNGTTRYEPVGTNLFTAPQARAMLEHVLAETQRSSHTAGSDENESGGAEPPALTAIKERDERALFDEWQSVSVMRHDPWYAWQHRAALDGVRTPTVEILDAMLTAYWPHGACSDDDRADMRAVYAVVRAALSAPIGAPADLPPGTCVGAVGTRCLMKD